ncbi:helix-turn-helix domain-containing protein [Candidatus Enterococcus ikei]|uniref:Helix-turn-helix domain-containing protein n=1 Tax=Candidatus Enterococcus ikei TaxID=2815326 RepID=A0ABS3GXF5_9ENTE|nr:helix-turn-helix domain-containing protein [Enterococcus sp. DIV0869a]MBO0439953.1 helix-turn-helix domain-containing protein [Enterococcus sp. DIV0869a]
MLEDILLDDVAQRKISVFNQLLTTADGTYSIHYFEQFTDFSYARLNSIFSEIHEDLMEKQNLSLLTDQGKVQIDSSKLRDIPYSQFLFRKSLPYKFLLATILENNYTIENFCRDHFISRASIIRRLQPLINYLKTFDIQLNCSKLQLTGKENLIRIVYLNFFWITSYGEDLFLALGEVKRGIDLFDQEDHQWMTYAEPREWYLLTTISKLRIKKKHFIIEPPFKQLVFPKTNTSFIKELEKFRLPQHYIDREATFLSFMMFYWNVYVYADDPRISYVKEYMDSEQQPLGNLIGRFEEFYLPLFSERKLTVDEKELLNINIFITCLNHSVLEDSLPLTINFMETCMKEQKPLYVHLSSKVRAFLKEIILETEFAWIRNCLEDLVYICSFLLLPFYERSNKKYQLNVGIILSPNAIFLQSLYDFLEQISFVSVSFVTSTSDDSYDFYIATSKLLLPDKIKQAKNFQIIPLSPALDYQVKLIDTLHKRYTEKSSYISV